MNKQGGIDYQDSKALERAKHADLITLPKAVDGTNCGNCKFVEIIDKKLGIGSCTHPEVLLAVTTRMCCAEWDHRGSIRSWKK